MKLSDTFDRTEGGSELVVESVPAVDAAEIEDDGADGVGGSPFAVGVKSDINVVDDDLIESSTDAAEDETDLYMDSNLDDMVSLVHVRSFDLGFLGTDCFEIEDAIS